MPTVWNVPIRSAPAEPSRSASRSASAARSPLRIRCAWRRTRAPASVVPTGARPLRRSSSGIPTIRSSAAICWLSADWV